MASYRFCRPDDIPYLVRAVNECWNVHFPDEAPMTVERFRAEMRYLDVWPSNSMVASSDAGPLAVMIGTKRSREVRILRLGVHPDHQRQGHGLHLLDSLSHKLAVLGPERLIVELPEDLFALRPFLQAAGYQHEETYFDHERDAAPAQSVPEEWLHSMTANEAIDFLESLLGAAGPLPWKRQPESLRPLGDELQALAFASPERLEACLLFRPAEGTGEPDEAQEILGLAVRPGPDAAKFIGLLLRHLASTGVALRLPKLAETVLPKEVLAGLGFRIAARHQLWAAEAEPA